mmetsp:Transcript_72573/g.121082  ORF Transcript_72573/g.121082 Transcript_72573/m.121082 type:complete len:343 (+) Transcript_72573:46-1074(+)|eukprot:CAMPEP_0119335814 /NCGR_PEP_ID=MMETSP1333-20130426/90433_1 /TAXON_ID=418940 /ORGANISM="Scyphosphaera apsteinii, Strain RCC1455" /LENGTH=342 /DNA_ID=CAMNT_0007346473 /DNA_START=46 /DNA_END=1074 /DNA_ORIENTATION=-
MSCSERPSSCFVFSLFIFVCHAAAGRNPCLSDLKGDYKYEACGAFCKPEKKQNHCKFCKCRSCQFCEGSAKPQKPTPTPAPVEPLRMKLAREDNKKAKRKHKRGKQKEPEPTYLPDRTQPPDAEQPASAPTTTATGRETAVHKETAAGKRKHCMSGIKGDYQFETCGGFCKENKAVNHCKFCKCRSCKFCPSTMGSKDAASKPAEASKSAGKPAEVTQPAVPAEYRAPIDVSAKAEAPETAIGSAKLFAAISGVSALLIIFVALAAFGSCSDLRLRLASWCGFSDSRSEEGQALVSNEERSDSGADSGWDDARASRKAVEDAFRSVELLEASLKRGHDRTRR